MLVINHKINFRTAYSQFYISDRDSPQATDSSNFWIGEAFTDKLAVEEGILGICTGTYSYVKGEISLLTHRPSETSFDDCDHVVEGSLEIKSGVLQVLDCPDSTVILELAIKPGFYRVRIKTNGLDSITDEDIEADDSYLIEVWPETAAPRYVLKKCPFSY